MAGEHVDQSQKERGRILPFMAGFLARLGVAVCDVRAHDMKSARCYLEVSPHGPHGIQKVYFISCQRTLKTAILKY